MSKLVEYCENATFCCAAALTKKEFLTAIRTLESRHLSSVGSGFREIYGVFSLLRCRKSTPQLAVSNQRIFSQGQCEVWSLSPSNATVLTFLRSIGAMVPDIGETKTRVVDQSSNQIAIVLWIRIGDAIVILGSDLERAGWIEILQSGERPNGNASMFKIPHHGSEDAHEPRVWTCMLEKNPVAVLTPWKRGRGALPTRTDVARIVSNTCNGYATSRDSQLTQTKTQRKSMVKRTVRESGISLRRLEMPSGAIRIRRPIKHLKNWEVEMIGPACHLKNFFD